MNFVLIVLMTANAGSLQAGGIANSYPSVAMAHFVSAAACANAERELRVMATQTSLTGRMETRCMPVGTVNTDLQNRITP
jgi:hypothetical protein